MLRQRRELRLFCVAPGCLQARAGSVWVECYAVYPSSMQRLQLSDLLYIVVVANHALPLTQGAGWRAAAPAGGCAMGASWGCCALLCVSLRDSWPPISTPIGACKWVAAEGRWQVGGCARAAGQWHDEPMMKKHVFGGGGRLGSLGARPPASCTAPRLIAAGHSAAQQRSELGDRSNQRICRPASSSCWAARRQTRLLRCRARAGRSQLPPRAAIMTSARSATAARALGAELGRRRPGAAAAAVPSTAALRWPLASRGGALAAHPAARQRPTRQRGTVRVQASKAVASSTIAGAAVTSWFKATGVPLLEALQQLTLQQVGWATGNRMTLRVCAELATTKSIPCQLAPATQPAAPFPAT